MAYRYDQYLSWSGGSDEARRFVTRRRPDGHTARELLFVPSLEDTQLQPGDLLEIHRSLFGWILAVNVWNGDAWPRNDLVTASKLRFDIFAWGACLPVLLLAYRHHWIAAAIGFVVWLATVVHEVAMRDRAAHNQGDLREVFSGRLRCQREMEALAGEPVTPSPPPLPQPYCTRFVEGQPITLGRYEGVMRAIHAGDLDLPSGRLVTLDPFSPGGRTPIDVPAGRWPVIAEFVQVEGFTMLCAARVRFSDGPAASWRRAGRGTPIPPAGLDVRVDGGLAAFADAEAVARLAETLGERRWAEAVDRRIRRPWGEQEHQRFALLGTRCTPGGMIAVESGEGDGTYPSYLELDANGAVVGVVLDFGFDNVRLFGPVESLNLATRRDAGDGGPARPFKSPA